MGTRLERLEYGKLCATPDGPIISGTEARVLARTPGFPAWLSRLCTPTQLGLSESELDLPSAQFPHGTVVRSLRAGGQLQLVAYRMRQRPEDGDGGTARTYWLGRYVFAPDESLDPATARATLAAPLVGLLANDTPLAAEEVTPAAGPSPIEAEDRKTILQALMYLMSGIPVGVAPPADDAVFFRLASALHFRLPTQLRPLFSVGWGVTSTVASRLAFSCSDRFSEQTAVVNLATGAFRPPRVLAESGAPFDPAALEPGRMYVHVTFARDRENKVDLNSMGAGFQDLLPLPVWRDAGSPSQTVPFAGEGGVAAHFASVGRHCLDHARFDLVSRWLAGEGADSGDGLCLSVDEYHSAAYRDALLRRAVEGLASGGDRGRAERLIWFSLRSEDAARVRTILASQRGEAAARARLLSAIELGADDVLSALAQAADAHADVTLPEEAQAHLELRLNATLIGQGSSTVRTAEIATAHARLIASGEPPVPYQRWARQQVEALSTLLAATKESTRARALGRLATFTQDQAPLMVERICAIAAPELGDAERLARSPLLRTWAVGELTRAWQTKQPDLREAIVPWLAACPPLLPEEPIAQLARGEKEVLAAHGPELARALAQGTLPAVLNAALAAQVLREWSSCAPLVQSNATTWRRVTSLLPRPVQWLLIGSPAASRPALGETATPLDRRVQEAALAVRPSEPRIDRMLGLKLQTSAVPDLADAAPYLWSWSGNSPLERGRDENFSQVCRSLRERRLPVVEPAPGVIEAVCQVARFGATAGELHAMRDDLWERIEGSGRLVRSHIQLLLSLFPEDDLIPQPRHIAALVPPPPWLAQLVSATSAVHPQRRARFAVATAGFHGLSYAGPDQALWCDEFQNSHVWMVFRHLPPQHQGELGAGLAAFAGNRGDRLLDYAGKWYHDQISGSTIESAHAASERIVRDVLVPMWINIGGAENEWQAFCAIIEGAKPAAAQKAAKAQRLVRVPRGSSEFPVLPERDALLVTSTFRDLAASASGHLGAGGLRQLFRGEETSQLVR